LPGAFQSFDMGCLSRESRGIAPATLAITAGPCYAFYTDKIKLKLLMINFHDRNDHSEK
jgi:hypothetical protein